jgi:hypothetical protein
MVFNRVLSLFLKKPGTIGGFWLVWLAGLIFIATPLASASEGHVVYDSNNVNGYHVTVLANPNPVSVGKIHLLIRVGLPTGVGQENPVQHGQVLVEFIHTSGPGADEKTSYLQRRDLVAEESEPGTYELDDSIQNEGVYRLTLNIQSGGHKIQTSFDLAAQPEPDDRFFSVLLLSLFPIFLAWLIWMYLKRPGQASHKPGKTVPVEIPATSPETQR